MNNVLNYLEDIFENLKPHSSHQYYRSCRAFIDWKGNQTEDRGIEIHGLGFIRRDSDEELEYVDGRLEGAKLSLEFNFAKEGGVCSTWTEQLTQFTLVLSVPAVSGRGYEKPPPSLKWETKGEKGHLKADERWGFIDGKYIEENIWAKDAVRRGLEHYAHRIIPSYHNVSERSKIDGAAIGQMYTCEKEGEILDQLESHDILELTIN